ncbi:MAG: RIP metalloprotease RseP [bacterium]
MIPSILMVALFIGALVTIHEFGHLVVAKLSGISVEVFSIGFGPTLLKRTWRGTEYRLAVVPLGGYIKMTGENEPAAGPAREDGGTTPPGTGFSDKPLAVKAAVIAAGPVSNLLLGFLLLSVMFGLFGMRYIAPVVDPAPDSPAAEAGLAHGDLVLAVNGDTVRSFEEIEDRLAAAAGGQLELAVRRDGTRLEFAVPVPADTWFSRDRVQPVVGSVKPGTPADSAGLLPRDSITGADGAPIANWYELVELARAGAGQPLELTWQRGESSFTRAIIPAPVTDPATGETIGQLGIAVQLPPRDIEPWVPPVVGQVRSRGPAAQAGIRRGDLITAVEGNPVARWDELLAMVNNRPGDTIDISWQRDGVTRSERIPVGTEKDQLTGAAVGQIGIWVSLARRNLPVHVAIWEGARRTGYIVAQTFVIIWQVIARRIPARAIGGPVFVAKIAYEGASWGAEYFIALWALLSINLFVVNLLPIPVLDGGRILLFVIEGVRRRKLTERELTWAMNIGWALIGLVFVLVLFNDFLRILGS